MIASLGELLRKHGLHARHSWGQNFLHAIGVHEAIARAESATRALTVVTQNVDGLHHRAGSTDVIDAASTPGRAAARATIRSNKSRIASSPR